MEQYQDRDRKVERSSNLMRMVVMNTVLDLEDVP